MTADRYLITSSTESPPNIPYFSSKTAILFSANSTKIAKKQRSKAALNKDVLPDSSAAFAQNANLTHPESRPDVNTEKG